MIQVSLRALLVIVTVSAVAFDQYRRRFGPPPHELVAYANCDTEAKPALSDRVKLQCLMPFSVKERQASQWYNGSSNGGYLSCDSPHFDFTLYNHVGGVGHGQMEILRVPDEGMRKALQAWGTGARVSFSGRYVGQWRDCPVFLVERIWRVMIRLTHHAASV